MLQDKFYRRVLIFFSLGCIEGFPILWWVFSIPSDADSRFFMGFSLARWTLIGAIGLICALSGAALAVLWRKRGNTWLYARAGDERLIKGLALASLIGLIVVFIAFLTLSTDENQRIQAIYSRIMPFIVYLLLVMGQAVILSVCLTRDTDWGQKRTATLGLILWGIFILSGLVIVFSRFGLEQISNGCYEYGVPLVTRQASGMLCGTLLVLSGGLLLFGNQSTQPGSKQPGRSFKPYLFDLLFLFVIWLSAVVVWLQFPVPKTWMSPEPSSPNYEIYPNSDALFYDASAQGILYGTEWAHKEIHYKPFYVSFLTILHGIVGNKYSQIIFLQTFVLAIFPAALYLLGKALHSRGAGFLVAVAAILREYNQLSISALATLSNSKLLLSELPTALLITILLVVLVYWLRKPQSRSILAVLSGGLIGLLIQIRLQSVVFLPALILFLLVKYYRSRKLWLAFSGLLCLGFVITVAPLVVRNFHASGTFALEKPGYFERTLDYSYQPVSGQNTMESQNASTKGGQSLGDRIYAVGYHFVHNTVSAVLTVSSNYGLPTGWSMTRDLKSLFWQTTSAPLNWPSALQILVNLGGIAMGVAVLWRINGWEGLLPALIFAAYNFSSAAGGFSGQRFILPIDWIGYFYFFIGVMWVATAILVPLGWNADVRLPFLTQKDQAETLTGSMNLGKKDVIKALPVLACLIIPAMLLPFEEMLIPVRYPEITVDQSRSQVMAAAAQALTSQQQTRLQSLLAQPDTQVMQGAAFYPRAYQDETSACGILRYAGQTPYPVLAYLFEGSGQYWVQHPLETIDQVSLPHGTRVIVVGKFVEGWKGGKSLRAFLTLRQDTQALLLSSDFSAP